MQISENVKNIVNKIENDLLEDFRLIDDISLFNQNKVLQSFIEHKVALRHFSQTTGYGYDDIGRDTLNLIYADIFKAEEAIVSSHLLSGTHALSTVLFGLLRPGDCLLSIIGKPYDTLQGIISGAEGSLQDFNIDYKDGYALMKNAPVKISKPNCIVIHKI